MKIGISFNPHGKGHARFGAGQFKRIKAEGFSAIDFSTMDTEREIYTANEEGLEEILLPIKNAVLAAGLEISQVHGPWRYPPHEATVLDRRERMEKMKRSVTVCRMLGCENWVVHPIMPYGINDIDIGMEKETWALNLEFMSELAEFAETQGVTVCLENMPFPCFSIATPEAILRLVRAVDRESFKACLDTGHVTVFPELSLGDSVRMLGSYLKVMHVHDNMGDRDSHLWPTRGATDWKDFATALKETGFCGVFSLETSADVKLDDVSFEKESVALFEIARSITEGI